MAKCLYCAVGNHKLCSRAQLTVYIGGYGKNRKYGRCQCYRRKHVRSQERAGRRMIA